MLKKIINLIPSLIASKLSRQVRELYSATIILNLAVSMINIFEPVFVFNLFYLQKGLKGTLESVLFFYLAVYSIYIFAIPLGVRFAKKYGYENSIAISSVFQIAFYFFLFISSRSLLFLPIAVIAYVLAKMFYWPAYHANFARFSADEELGREISNLWILSSLVVIIAPLIGGLIIEFFGFKVLFLVASLLILASNIPMLATKEDFQPQDFSFLKAFKNLFDKKNRREFWSIFGFGEEFIVLVLWPIFMFLTVYNFLGLGIISAFSILISTLILLFVGHWTDKKDRKSLFIFGVVSYVFSWIMRILARNNLGILIVDAYSRISKNIISVPLMTSVYTKAHNGSVMSTIAFFEMSLVIGKLTAIIICLFILQIFSPGWNSIFVLGAIFTLFYLLFNTK